MTNKNQKQSPKKKSKATKNQQQSNMNSNAQKKNQNMKNTKKSLVSKQSENFEDEVSIND